MSVNKSAYTYDIVPNSPDGKDIPVHQTDPAWVLTFLRWEVRDTLRTKYSQAANWSTIAPKPLVVENDCIQLSVSDSKSVLTPSMMATLKVTDINYETEVAPGDFVFVNMLNWEVDARKVADQARKLKPINGIEDGFKGFFKVQSVRKTLIADPQSGTKTFAVKLTGFAFTEFNNSIYFNPNLINNTTDQNLQLYLTNLGKDWNNLQTDKGTTSIQDIVTFLIISLIGNGFPDNKKTSADTPITANTHFYMPQGVGNLLGLGTVEAAKDVYNYLFGIQRYLAQAQTPAQGMNPADISTSAAGQKYDPTASSRFMTVPDKVEGQTITKPEYWNQVKTWSILNQFSNSPLNEMYTCFKIAPNGSVMPTLVFRQIPFTSDNFRAGNFVVTRFMTVPRWHISSALALSFDLGRDEALRLNFMQFYGIPVNAPAIAAQAIASQTSSNYVFDIDDVKRNGLRPAVITSEFDLLSKSGEYRAPGWAKIMGDALIGGHLKMSGTINYVGIPEPIAVGDNLQFDGVVYHIEQISHNAEQNMAGKKIFRTTVTVSFGMDIENGQNTVYNEMTYGNAYKKRASDYDHDQLLPGVSESQDIESRKTGPDPTKLPSPEGDSYTEPNTNTSINKTTRDS